MKKLLSLVLVLAVVLSSMSFAFAAAPSDLDGYKYADSVQKLVGLGIINGYPDGTFKPTGNITRAEFAKVVVTALGYADAATASGEAKFSDVAGHWAQGFVNVASSLGIINGVGGGKFAPDANVKYEEAVTMIVRALGYEPAAKSNGGYPNGYLTIASQKKITKDVALVAGSVADRGTVAKLLAESLEVPFLKQTGYGTLTTFEEAKDADGNATESLLISGLKLEKYTPTVDSYDTTEKTITFTGYDVDKKKTVSYVDPIDPTATQNSKVTVWYKDGTIYSFKNETTIKIDRLKKVNGEDTVLAGNDADTTFLDTVELQNGGKFDTVQNSTNTTYTGVLKVNDSDFSGKVSGLIGDYAKIYSYDGKVYRVEAFTLGTAGLITEASATKIKYQKYDANDVYLSNIDAAEDLLYVFIDGQEKSVSDLKADMYFQFIQPTSKKLIIAASTGKVTGKLSVFSTDTATVGGTKYDTVGNNVTGTDKYISYNNGTKFEKNILDDLVNIDVVAYKNFENKLAFVKGTATSTTTDFYGLVKTVKVEGKSLTIVRDVNGTSTEVDYAVKTDSDDLKTSVPANFDWSEFLTAVNGGNAGDVTDDQNETDATQRIYKFYLNSDNKITKIEQIVANANYNAFVAAFTPGASAKFNKDTGKIEGTSYYVDGATIFDVTNNKVVYWNDIKDRTASGALVTLATDKSNGTKANVLAFLDDTYESVNATDKFYAYVTSEVFDGTYYNITTSDNETLKIHKDDVGSFKQMDKQFLTYIKDGEKIKVRSVAKAVYQTTNEFNAGTGDVYDYGTFTTVSQDTFNKVDGDYVVVDGLGYLKKASDIKVIKITWKADKSDIDTALVSDVTSIADNDKVLLVQDSDGAVRAIYYVHN